MCQHAVPKLPQRQAPSRGLFRDSCSGLRVADTLLRQLQPEQRSLYQAAACRSQCERARQQRQVRQTWFQVQHGTVEHHQHGMVDVDSVGEDATPAQSADDPLYRTPPLYTGVLESTGLGQESDCRKNKSAGSRSSQRDTGVRTPAPKVVTSVVLEVPRHDDLSCRSTPLAIRGT